MNAKFHLCMLLIILGAITVQGATTRKNGFAKRRGECSWKLMNLVFLTIDN